MNEQEAKEKRITRRRTDNFIVWFLVWPIVFSISFLLVAGIIKLFSMDNNIVEIRILVSALAACFSAWWFGNMYRQKMKEVEQN